MKQKEIKSIIENIGSVISLSAISRTYFAKDKSWLYHKLNEDIVHGVKYALTDEELQTLTEALTDIAKRITLSARELKKLKQKRERSKGRYLTEANPFSHRLFQEWFALIPPNATILEPFAGACNIPKLINTLIANVSWACYDIEPIKDKDYKTIKRDTLMRFPTGFKVCITNPPFLAKNSATRRKLAYPSTQYDDVYKLALDVMLKNCDYVAAILPERFITSGLFRDRLWSVVSIVNPLMFSDTDCPVCLAMFTPYCTPDFQLYIGDKYVGNYNELEGYSLHFYDKSPIQWEFNNPVGEIGVICYDGYSNEGIKFVMGNSITPERIKHSSRALTRVGGLPKHIPLRSFIAKCNKILAEYRRNTHDVFLTSFKGLRKDGKYRRRIDFKTVRQMMNKALQEF